MLRVVLRRLFILSSLGVLILPTLESISFSSPKSFRLFRDKDTYSSSFRKNYEVQWEKKRGIVIAYNRNDKGPKTEKRRIYALVLPPHVTTKREIEKYTEAANKYVYKKVGWHNPGAHPKKGGTFLTIPIPEGGPHSFNYDFYETGSGISLEEVINNLFRTLHQQQPEQNAASTTKKENPNTPTPSLYPNLSIVPSAPYLPLNSGYGHTDPFFNSNFNRPAPSSVSNNTHKTPISEESIPAPDSTPPINSNRNDNDDEELGNTMYKDYSSEAKITPAVQQVFNKYLTELNEPSVNSSPSSPTLSPSGALKFPNVIDEKELLESFVPLNKTVELPQGQQEPQAQEEIKRIILERFDEVLKSLDEVSKTPPFSLDSRSTR